MSIKLNIDHSTPAGNSFQATGLHGVVGFRWDKADLSMYYCLTGELLYSTDVPQNWSASYNGTVRRRKSVEFTMSPRFGAG